MGQETTERYRTLKNGAVYDMERKRIVANPGGGTTAITQATASQLHQARRNKMQAMLRRGIVEAHNGSMPEQVRSSPAAFAASGAMLYEQVVLNSEAYPRDRLQVWRELGQAADVLPDRQQAVAADTLGSGLAAATLLAVASMADVWRDVMQRQAVEGRVVEDSANVLEVDGGQGDG